MTKVLFVAFIGFTISLFYDNISSFISFILDFPMRIYTLFSSMPSIVRYPVFVILIFLIISVILSIISKF